MRRLLIGLLASLLALGAALALAPGGASAQQDRADDGTDEGPSTDVAFAYLRFGGGDRYETSLRIAEVVATLANDQLDVVVLVSGERWTDAVVAAPLAGARGAPVLLTPPDELRGEFLRFLQRVGTSTAIIVGPVGNDPRHGPGRGVSATVERGLRDIGLSVERIAGADRFGTSVAVAERLKPGDMPGLGNGNTVIVASGDVFADALVAGPFAALGPHPVLLTPPDELHADVADYLRVARARDNVRHVVVMGGTAALAEPVSRAIADAGMSVTRLAGATRFDTAVQAAELVEDRYEGIDDSVCFEDKSYGIARADVPFDSLSAAPLLGRLCTSLLLTNPRAVPVPTAVYLDLKLQQLAEIDIDADAYFALLHVFGGEAAVQQASLDTYLSEATQRIAEGRAGEIDNGSDWPDDSDEQHDTSSKQSGSSAPALDCGGSIGDEARRLVPSTNAEDPAWSPDCSRLVYTENGSLWTVANDGSDRRRLLDRGAAYLYSAAWSPDGTEIAYVRGHQSGGNWRAHIWKVNASGGQPVRLTGGAVRDEHPHWSPDGTSILFQRAFDWLTFVLLMDRDGDNVTALSSHGHPQVPLAWSPDGTKFAFVEDGTLYVTDVGNRIRRWTVTQNVYPRGEVAWSPSGNRIAYARGDISGSDIYIADIDGTNEEQVTDLDGQALAPRWSPDGKLLAFHTITDDGKHRSFVVGASGEPSPWRTNCRLDVSHPWPHGDLPASGTLRVAVLFVDFPDAAPDHSTREEADVGLPYVEQYLEASSYGKLDIEFVPVHRWLRADHTAAENIARNGHHLLEADGELTNRAVRQVSGDLDISTVDAVMVVFPSSHFETATSFAPRDVGGKRMPVMWLNTFPVERPRVPRFWGADSANQIGHFVGLPSLFRYPGQPDIQPAASETWVHADWGLMNLDSYFLASREHAGLLEVWHYANGTTGTGHHYRLRPEEMLAWNRWHLDWLEEEQVSCVTGHAATVELSPIAEPGDGVAMVVIPQNSYSAIVLESRRELGYDSDRQVQLRDGTRGTLPRLITEGVLAYTVNTSLGSGQSPISFAGTSDSVWLAEDPILALGESIEVQGYEITVTADSGNTHTVQIRKVT
ncbi:cell wall-binding repeat-containing protein [Candidatus Poriferisodalis sp.]|uniref:cell wall-binding repeat-containing protein n=1 Tax=Candidatus Poriferisodalis sp. TaxID=3101277 RepID=UPI003B01339D